MPGRYDTFGSARRANNFRANWCGVGEPPNLGADRVELRLCMRAPQLGVARRRRRRVHLPDFGEREARRLESLHQAERVLGVGSVSAPSANAQRGWQNALLLVEANGRWGGPGFPRELADSH
jgi:hypothetical protein